jgi:hypothetical protein
VLKVCGKSVGPPGLHERVYQFEQEYRFDSSKTEGRFGLKPTSYRDGILATLD